MINRRFLLGSAASLVALSAQAQTPPTPASGGSRADEVAALRHFAEITHPRGVFMAQDPAWAEYWDQLRRDADRLSFEVYVMHALGGLALFADGHTTVPIGAISTGGFALRAPMSARPFYDGLYVTSAKDEALPLLGAKLTRIAGVETGELIRRFAATWPGNNPAWAHHDAGLLLVPGVLQGMGLLSGAGTAIPIEGVSPSGRRVRARLTPTTTGRDGRTQMRRPALRQETWAGEANSGNYVKPLAAEGAIYVSFDHLDIETADAEVFTRTVFAAMEDSTPTRLVIDLRRNGGGNNFLGEGLRHRIARSRFNRPGGLYVLIGPQTFSAAQNLTNRLERETFATFVGEPTGGAPNHYGDARPFTGPSSGVMFLVSTLPWFDSMPMDHRRWIMPDLLSPSLYADFEAGSDPALDLALTHRDDAPAEDLTEERVFYFARPSQAAQWTPFWSA